MGLFRLIIDTPVALLDDFAYTEGSFLWIMNSIFFQYYSLLITIVCIGVMIGVSYATEEPDYQRISGLTFSTMTDEHKAENKASYTRGDVIASALVLVLIVIAYIYFSG